MVTPHRRRDELAVELSSGIVTICEEVSVEDDGSISCTYGGSPAPTWDSDEVERIANTEYYNEIYGRPDYKNPWGLK